MSRPVTVVCLLGLPGSGKTTQAQRLVAGGAELVSTGDLIRGLVAGGDPPRWVQRAAEGTIPPPAVITRLALGAVAAAAERTPLVVVDGFPRTAAQLRAWDAARPPVRTVGVALLPGDDVRLGRIGRRVLCRACRHVQGSGDGPRCRACGGGDVVARRDDGTAVMARRMARERRHLGALVDAFGARHELAVVEGGGADVDAVAARVAAVVRGGGTRRPG
jgi:adenylate kinase family enzyme